MSKPTIYEHPLNERMRIMLRLELLFSQMQHFKQGKSPWDSRVFLSTMMDILDLFSRGDLKTELLKEADRAANTLNQLLEHPGVDHDRLRSILRALQHISASLHNFQGQLGQALREDNFLSSIRQRSTIPGGTCDFDLPAYHQWLSTNSERRTEDQANWFSELDSIRQAIELLLKLIRNSSEPAKALAEKGGYLQSLDPAQPYQMIRIIVPAKYSCYAEVSGGRHRFTVRFMQLTKEKAVQVDYDLDFFVSGCVF